jgi:NADH dehydrogenase/NADH:ubiquinone oxidoreductase subunit G
MAVSLTIDGKEITVPDGTTIHAAAKQAGIDIPTICYDERCTANGLCRMCVVEVVGARVLAASCVAPATQGMQVATRSERVDRSRRTILEMLDSAVDLSEAPEIQAHVAEYSPVLGRFGACERRDPPVVDDNPMYVRDYNKCILCWRCVQVCADDAQRTYAINFDGRGFATQIGTFEDKPMPETSCVFCGQCVGVCPTNALKPKREYLLEQGRSRQEIFESTRANRGGRRRKRDA